MKWLEIILLIVMAIATINLLIAHLNQQNLFFQVLYAFICENKEWRKYRILKKYLKNNSIPIIDIRDYEGNNSGFAFIQYDNTIFAIQGDDIYISSYYNHLIKDLLKHNKYEKDFI